MARTLFGAESFATHTDSTTCTQTPTLSVAHVCHLPYHTLTSLNQDAETLCRPLCSFWVINPAQQTSRSHRMTPPPLHVSMALYNFRLLHHVRMNSTRTGQDDRGCVK